MAIEDLGLQLYKLRQVFFTYTIALYSECRLKNELMEENKKVLIYLNSLRLTMKNIQNGSSKFNLRRVRK